MDIIEEISEFLNLTREDVISKMENGASLVKEDWIKANPKTEEEVINFYKTCKNYIFDLAYWHEKPLKKIWDMRLIELVRKKQHEAKNILDYGCGIGSNGFLFYDAGFTVTLADLDSIMLNFAKFIIKKYSLDINVIEIDKEEIKGKFDVILCLDALEHVKKPKKILEELVSHLNDGGKIFLTIAEPDFIHPMHFKIGKDFWDYLEELEKLGKIGRLWVRKSE